MASLSPSDGFLESLAQEAKKNDTAFMDIIKEFPVSYNRACADFKDRNIKKNAWQKISELLDVELLVCELFPQLVLFGAPATQRLPPFGFFPFSAIFVVALRYTM